MITWEITTIGKNAKNRQTLVKSESLPSVFSAHEAGMTNVYSSKAWNNGMGGDFFDHHGNVVGFVRMYPTSWVCRHIPTNKVWVVEAVDYVECVGSKLVGVVTRNKIESTMADWEILQVETT